MQRSELSPAHEPAPAARSRIGWIVIMSMAVGVLLAVVVVILPVVPAEERAMTGGVLLACPVGGGRLAVLSVHFNHEPQRWAAVPAAFLGLTGVAALSGS